MTVGLTYALKFAVIVLATLAAPRGDARAQAVRGLDAQDSNGQPGAPSSFIIEPDAQIKGDQIKQRTYRSQAVGKNRNWDLDIGRFQPLINEDPSGLAEDIEDNDYSGMRLRLPFRGRTGQ
ncbi:MAG: hypothetical protein MPJ78_09055 [Hyphomicrobiaceae bacterium]|nr:hypothetical protein [Hyphomicrobiaceae bacterium]